MNQRYKRYLPLVLGFTAVCMSTQAVYAQVNFDFPQQDTNLQAQLPSSIQQLQLRNVQVSSDGLVLQMLSVFQHKLLPVHSCGTLTPSFLILLIYIAFCLCA